MKADPERTRDLMGRHRAMSEGIVNNLMNHQGVWHARRKGLTPMAAGLPAPGFTALPQGLTPLTTFFASFPSSGLAAAILEALLPLAPGLTPLCERTPPGFPPDTRPGEDTMALDFLYGERVAYTVPVRRHFVFRTAGDKLFLAVYGTHKAGCTVCAVDVKEGRVTWQTELKGTGFVNLSAYSNYVNMDLRPRGLEIIGHEAYGDYWERLSPLTGRTIGHRVFREGWD